VVKNLQQGFSNSWFRSADFRNSIRGIAKALSSGGKELAEKSGATSNAVINDYIEDLTGAIQGRRGFGQKFANIILKGTLFRWSEQLNRRFAANIGSEYLQNNLIPKLKASPKDVDIRTELKTLGVSADKVLKDGLTEDDILRAANSFSRETQFAADELALPLFWTTPEGRLITQFKTFSFNQAKLLNKSFKKSPIGTPLRIVALASTIGVTVSEISDFLRGKTKKEQETFLNRAWGGFLTIGGYGLISDIAESEGRFGEKGLLQLLAGPTGGDVVEIISKGAAALGIGAETVIEREVPVEDVEKLGKETAIEVFRRTPVVGPAAAQRLRDEDDSSRKVKTRKTKERKIVTRK